MEHTRVGSIDSVMAHMRSNDTSTDRISSPTLLNMPLNRSLPLAFPGHPVRFNEPGDQRQRTLVLLPARSSSRLLSRLDQLQSIPLVVENTYVDTPCRASPHLQTRSETSQATEVDELPPSSLSSTVARSLIVVSTGSNATTSIWQQPTIKTEDLTSKPNAESTSIMCPQCRQCRCARCTTPQELPLCCGGNCTPNDLIEYCSCLRLVHACFYCVTTTGDGHDGSDDSCSCAPRHNRCARWTCLVVSAVTCLPGLCCYWPLRGCLVICTTCYNRHRTRGCRCRPLDAVRNQPTASPLLIESKITTT